MAANIPTLIYWDEKYWEIPREYKDDFNDLRRIYHNSVDTLIKVLEENWDDVSQWWYPVLQNV